MIIKGAIKDEIQFRISGGLMQRGSKYTDDRLIYQAMDSVRDMLVMDYISKANNFVPQGYIKTFKNVPVLFDSDLDRYYCTLPVKILGLSQNKGIIQVSLMKGQNKPLDYIEIMYQSMLQDGDLLGATGYYVEDNIIYLFSQPSVSDFSKGLLLYLVRAGDSILPTEQYVQPELQAQVTDLTIQRLTNEKPEDKSNNNVD